MASLTISANGLATAKHWKTKDKSVGGRDYGMLCRGIAATGAFHHGPHNASIYKTEDVVTLLRALGSPACPGTELVCREP